ncbi:MAG: hypothetical protein JNJ48_06225, partial [Phycisphaerae bacterium]|nr:hypothetical protein [Phycisphaerae bacterium]
PPGVDPAAPDLALDRAPSGPAGDATAPAPGSTIRDSRTAVARSYTLGARLGASGGFVEYEIADPPDPGSTLKAADAAFGDPIERLRSVEAGRAALSGALPHRLLPIRAVLPDARPPCFVQQRVEPPAITVAAASRTAPGLTPEQQSAVVDLFADLAAADLIWEDGRPENILLRPGPDGRWEALVIAPERLAPIANWSADPALERLVPLIQTAPLHRSVGLLSLAESAIAPGAATALQRGVQLLPDAGAFMVKMLEYKGRYIRCDRAARRFERVLIDPELVRRRFPDLDRLVDAPLTPTMILPRAAPSNPDTLPPPAPPR